MRRLGSAGVALAVTAVAEVVVFVLIAHAIGYGWAVAVVLLTTLVGAWLLRREGMRGWRRFRSALADGRAPGDEASDGLLGLLGALLLVLPGFLTDVAGLVLLTPPVRRLARARVRRAAERRVSAAVAGGMFGPRRVRAYRGPAASAADAPPPRPSTPGPAISAATSAPTGPPDPSGAAIDGEIVDPDARD